MLLTNTIRVHFFFNFETGFNLKKTPFICFPDVFKFETSSAGWVSALPYLAMALTLQVAGHLADCLLRRGTFSRTNIRKIFNCGAFLSQVGVYLYWVLVSQAVRQTKVAQGVNLKGRSPRAPSTKGRPGVHLVFVYGFELQLSDVIKISPRAQC